MKLTLHIPGIPAPGGSKRGFYIPKLKRVVITDAGGERTKNWRAVCASMARQQYNGDPLQGPLQVTFMFFMPRPKGHYGSGKNAAVLKPNAPTFHTSKPDATKLVRSTEDALTQILWVDDSQIAIQRAEKRYGSRPGCIITVETIGTISEPEAVLVTPSGSDQQTPGGLYG